MLNSEPLEYQLLIRVNNLETGKSETIVIKENLIKMEVLPVAIDEGFNTRNNPLIEFLINGYSLRTAKELISNRPLSELLKGGHFIS